MSREVFICDAVRAPIGRFGDGLSAVRADDLAAAPLKVLVECNPGVDWSVLDEMFLGCANRTGEDNHSVACMVLLLAGLLESAPGVTLSCLCASGMDAIGMVFRAIVCGEMGLAVVGGAESMSHAPYMMGKADSTFGRGQKIEDTTIGWRFVNPLMKKQYGTDPMSQTADDVADDYRVSRADQDAFALCSQQCAGRAQAAGFFVEEIVPVTIRGRKDDALVEYDEYLRLDVTLEALARLKPVNGPGKTVTAGNTSGVNDGATVPVLVSAEAVKKHGLTPCARVLGMASADVASRIMGIGPVPVVRKLLRRLDPAIDALDVTELNEAFASQGLACLRELSVVDDSEKVNPNGGAIVLGHPLGMSGARLALTVFHQLERNSGWCGLAAICVGIGQGLALAIERVRLTQPGCPPGTKSARHVALPMVRRWRGTYATEQDVPSYGQDETDPAERTTA